MNNKADVLTEEKEYLKDTLSFIENQLKKEQNEMENKEAELVLSRREMYENTSHHAQDFNKLTEIIQYLNPLNMQTMDFEATRQRVLLYERVKDNPYFARVNFDASDWGMESIYIGVANIENDDTFKNYVYDWRAPISSLYYQYELGKAQYEAPAGTIEGVVTLKRQFEINKGNLNYFFDSSVNIIDEILKETLSQNSSEKMRTIIETIQREQDSIIRDTSSDLLIVQGVAGSGKTSIALHRAAYLMYEGLSDRINANNMILISPNNLFAQYISEVLPELGERNIETITFEKLFYNNYKDNMDLVTREEMLEEILTVSPQKRKLLEESLAFKSSSTFFDILKRLISYYQYNIVEFSDVMYAGKTIAKKELLKARFLETSTKNLQIQVRLNHIEQIVSDEIKKYRPKRLAKLEDYYAGKSERSLDFRAAARLASTKEISKVMHNVRRFTRINFLGLYKTLFSNKAFFKKITKGIKLPENIDEIISITSEKLQRESVDYSDGMAILLMKLSMDADRPNLDIRQVVVDEAQDYSAVHFEILARLFPSAKYTVLGDINQSIVNTDDSDVYQSVKTVLNKKKTITVKLNKSFRCSFEITQFASQFADKDFYPEQLNRHNKPPEILGLNSVEAMDEAVANQINQWEQEGYKRSAIICKSGKDAEALYRRIFKKISIKLLLGEEVTQFNGVVILPIYLAKGLEFDAVAVYNTSDEIYVTDQDRRLLYIASTRALHRLNFYYLGKKSRLIIADNK